MAEVTMMGASTAAASEASSYRIKFERENFIELVRLPNQKSSTEEKHVLLCLRRLRNVLQPM